MDLEQIGGYALIAGVLISILAGVIQNLAPDMLGAGTAGWILLAVVLLGIIVGLLNIKDEDTTTFLIATIALIATSSGGARLITIDQITKVFGFGLGSLLQTIVLNIAVFAAPAALVIALKTVYTTASNAK